MSEASSAEHGFRVLAAVLRYQKPLVAYAASLLGDVDRARDMVQETFLRLCGEEEIAEDRVAAWLFRVCRNRSIDELRKEKRLTPFDQRDEGGDDALTQLASDPTLPDVVELRKDATTVLHLIQALPPKQQDVLRLKFLADLSYREISKVTELEESYVGYLIHVGLKSIREKLARVPREAGLRREVT